jgi:hypothetical protein
MDVLNRRFRVSHKIVVGTWKWNILWLLRICGCTLLYRLFDLLERNEYTVRCIIDLRFEIFKVGIYINHVVMFSS